MKKSTKYLWAAVGFLVAFVLWTGALTVLDRQPVGPGGSPVGFAALNGQVHALTGHHPGLYLLTDLLSLIPGLFAAGFALLGLAQWIRRRSLLQVDRSILLLGIFYLAVLAVYLLFEACPVNFRPVLIDGRLEASYPSSTTVLVLCVMATAALQLKARMKNSRPMVAAITAFSAFMVLARLLSGVHWVTDILGGILLSAGLVLLYRAALERWGL